MQRRSFLLPFLDFYCCCYGWRNSLHGRLRALHVWRAQGAIFALNEFFDHVINYELLVDAKQ